MVCQRSGKVIHRSYQEASEHAAGIAKRGEVGKRHGMSICIYTCRYCRHFHVSSKYWRDDDECEIQGAL